VGFTLGAAKRSRWPCDATDAQFTHGDPVPLRRRRARLATAGFVVRAELDNGAVRNDEENQNGTYGFLPGGGSGFGLGSTFSSTVRTGVAARGQRVALFLELSAGVPDEVLDVFVTQFIPPLQRILSNRSDANICWVGKRIRCGMLLRLRGESE